MHARTISMEQWAETYEALEFPAFSKAGLASITTGEHPHLGYIIAVQVMDNAVSITTELPFTDRAERQSAESGDALARAVVAAATSRTRRPKPVPIEEIDIDDLAATLAELDHL